MKYQFNPFVIEYDRVLSINDFKTECMFAAQTIAAKNTNNKPIVVMMSGGIDSQLVAESMLLSDISFVCVIARLCTRLSTGDIIFNEHDYQYAERWCKLHGIEILYCDIDIFKEAKLISEYALSSKGFSPQYACHMYIMKWCKERGFYYVAGMGEIDIVLKDGIYHTMDEQREFALYNFCQAHNIEGEFLFWKQNSRLTAATLELPTVKKLMERREPKLIIHKHGYFSDVFHFEMRNKYTGFEKIQEWDFIIRTALKSHNIQYDSKFYTPISHFQRKE